MDPVERERAFESHRSNPGVSVNTTPREIPLVNGLPVYPLGYHFHSGAGNTRVPSAEQMKFASRRVVFPTNPPLEIPIVNGQPDYPLGYDFTTGVVNPLLIPGDLAARRGIPPSSGQNTVGRFRQVSPSSVFVNRNFLTDIFPHRHCHHP
jgi:hypothetical protein